MVIHDGDKQDPRRRTRSDGYTVRGCIVEESFPVINYKKRETKTKTQLLSLEPMTSLAFDGDSDFMMVTVRSPMAIAVIAPAVTNRKYRRKVTRLAATGSQVRPSGHFTTTPPRPMLLENDLSFSLGCWHQHK